MCAATATLDRVVASVDYRAITESDVESEYRLDQFVAGRMPDGPPDEQAREHVREELIDQMLLSAESRHVEDGDIQPADSEQDLEAIRAKFPSPQAFDVAMASLGLTRQQLLERLARRQEMLNLIDRRLRPDVFVDTSEIEAYYQQTFLPQFRARNGGTPPPLNQVEDQIREILTQRKVNDLLEGWLKDLRANHRVEVRAF